MKKRIGIRKNPLIVLGLLLLLIYSCKKEEKTPVPVLTTSSVSDISQTTATCGGKITSDGGFQVTASGVCWSTTHTPATDGSKILSGVITGTFSIPITGLIVNTVYYVRAYATNSEGTAYGNEISFKTSPAIIPGLTTKVPNSMTQTAAISGGNITNDGGIPVTARGVCWSTTENPSIVLTTKTLDGIGTGAFTSSISGLTLGVVYYIRAYATNSVGTSYGEQKSFTMDPTHLTDTDGNVYETITIGTQTWMKENLKTTRYLDGSAITLVSDNPSWSNLTTGAYSWYNNDATYKNTYGALYNFYTIQDSRGLCPTGWHVPTEEEWITLFAYLGGESIAGDKLKEVASANSHWKPYDNGSNKSGFTALPGGDRYIDGICFFIGTQGHWWSSTEYDANNVWNHSILSYFSDVKTFYGEKQIGNSVRCVRDL